MTDNEQEESREEGYLLQLAGGVVSFARSYGFKRVVANAPIGPAYMVIDYDAGGLVKIFIQEEAGVLAKVMSVPTKDFITVDNE